MDNETDKVILFYRKITNLATSGRATFKRFTNQKIIDRVKQNAFTKTEGTMRKPSNDPVADKIIARIMAIKNERQAAKIGIEIKRRRAEFNLVQIARIRRAWQRKMRRLEINAGITGLSVALSARERAIKKALTQTTIGRPRTERLEVVLANLAKPISALGLPVRLQNLLPPEAKKVWQLCEMTENDLLSRPGLGSGSLRTIGRSLAEFGLSLGMNLEAKIRAGLIG